MHDREILVTVISFVFGVDKIEASTHNQHRPNQHVLRCMLEINAFSNVALTRRFTQHAEWYVFSINSPSNTSRFSCLQPEPAGVTRNSVHEVSNGFGSSSELPKDAE